MKIRLSLILLLLSLPAFAFEFKPGATVEVRVELNEELRKLAGEGRISPVKFARIAAALPPGFDPARPWPIMVISATSSPRHYASNVRLLGFYAPAAAAAGWVLVAADPDPDIDEEADSNAMRVALIEAAFAALESKWPLARKSPLAFGGFSGGAKRSGWLAGIYRLSGRQAMGVFQAGINEETVALAAKHFKALDDGYRQVPVFLLAGTKDEIATESDHRRIERELKRAGFKHVQLETFPGPHAVDPRPLRRALAWFDEVRGKAAEPKDKQAEAR